MYLNNLQSYIFAVILTFVVGFVACEKSSIGNHPSAQTLMLRINENKTVTFDVISPLDIKVKNVNDSRCPEGGNCIRAGEAIVAFVAKERNDSLSISLSIPKNTQYPNHTHFELSGHEYQATLKDVSPYPNLRMTAIGSPTVSIIISKLR